MKEIAAADVVVFGSRPDLYQPGCRHDVIDYPDADPVLRLAQGGETIEDLSGHIDLTPFTPTGSDRSGLEVLKTQSSEPRQPESPSAGRTWNWSILPPDGYSETSVFLPVLAPGTRVDAESTVFISAFMHDPFRPVAGEPDIYDTADHDTTRTFIFTVPQIVDNNHWLFPEARVRTLFSLTGSEELPASHDPELDLLLADCAPVVSDDLTDWVQGVGLYRSDAEEQRFGFIHPHGQMYYTKRSGDGRLLALAFYDRHGNRIIVVPSTNEEHTAAPALTAVLLNLVLDLDSSIDNHDDLLADLGKVDGNLLHKLNIPDSAAWQLCVHRVASLALHHTPQTHYLVVGPTGVGKELIAWLIQRCIYPDQKKPVIVNCGLLTEQLAASHIFGHQKGAFTGASAKRSGAATEADNNVLFLDEFQEFVNKPDGPSHLLRLMEDEVVVPVGGSFQEGKKVNITIVAATNDLDLLRPDARATRSGLIGRFRHTIHVPGLNLRWSDVRPLVHYFVRELADQLEKRCSGSDMNLLTDQIVSELDLELLFSSNIRHLHKSAYAALIGFDYSAGNLPPVRGRAGVWATPSHLLTALKKLSRSPESCPDGVTLGTYLNCPGMKELKKAISEMAPHTKAKRQKFTRRQHELALKLVDKPDVIRAIERIARMNPDG